MFVDTKTCRQVMRSVVVALIPLAGPQAALAGEIAWIDSPIKAAQMGRQFNLPVVMYLTSEHCGFCRQMERETWSNKSIVSMVDEGFIPLKVHAEQHRDLVSTLGVRGFPTTIVFSPQAKAIKVASGYLSPPQVAAMLREAALVASPTAASAPIAPAGAELIQWEASAEQALKVAQETRRPVIVYISREQCGDCRRMEADVWSDAAITAAIRTGFVPLALRAERDAALIAALQVTVYPTTVVVSPERQVTSGLVGFAPASDLQQMLQQARTASAEAQKLDPSR